MASRLYRTTRRLYEQVLQDSVPKFVGKMGRVVDRWVSARKEVVSNPVEIRSGNAYPPGG